MIFLAAPFCLFAFLLLPFFAYRATFLENPVLPIVFSEKGFAVRKHPRKESKVRRLEWSWDGHLSVAETVPGADMLAHRPRGTHLATAWLGARPTFIRFHAVDACL